MANVLALLAVRHFAGERDRYRVACPSKLCGKNGRVERMELELELELERCLGHEKSESRGDGPSLSTTSSGRRNYR
jgi:hypothetical protein